MKNKFGFTLAEVMIVLVVIGVIAVLTIQTVVMQKESFNFSCYHLFRDLKIAVGHMAAQSETGGLNSFSCEKAADVSASAYQTCVADGKAGNSNAYIMNYKTGTGFCQGLARTLGTASAVNCTSLNDATLSDVYGSMTNESFRLMNGYIVYVSNRQVGTNSPYRIVTFDLNGNNKPNENGKDIISFAIFDSGEILPVGEAATSTNHFRAIIKIYNILPRTGTDGTELTDSQKKALDAMRHPAHLSKTKNGKYMTFKDAYCRAFGTSESYSAYCSGYTDFNEAASQSGYSDDNYEKISDSVPIRYCQTHAQKETNETTGAEETVKYYECELTIIKPQVSKFIPISQDVYSSKNNDEDIEDGSSDANQIFKY